MSTTTAGGTVLHAVVMIDDFGETARYYRMLITTLDARVPDELVDQLKTAYSRLSDGPRPKGFVNSRLSRGVRDPDAWRIETAWESREALMAMREQGTPAGLLLFRALGIEPEIGVFEVVEMIDAKA